MTRRVPRIVSGQKLVGLRQPINKIVDAVNQLAAAPVGGIADAVLPRQIVKVQIRAFDIGGPPFLINCVAPGEVNNLNPNTREYKVRLPETLDTELRQTVSYVYTDINNRTADGTEVQKLTPEYLVFDFLYVIEMSEGDGSYIDINIDGRQWAKVP